MNKDSFNLSLKERFELQISDEAVTREVKKIKIYKALIGNAQQLQCIKCEDCES